MAESSYEKVVKIMLGHGLFQEYVNMVEKRLETLRISKVGFNMSSDNTTSNPTFSLIYDGKDSEFSIWERSLHNIDAMMLDFEHFAPRREISNLAKRIWNTGKFPTYNCRLELADKHKRGQSSILNIFPSMANDYLRTTLEMAISDAQDKIKCDLKEKLASSEMPKMKADFVERTAINEIKSSLMKYRHLDDSVLRAAFEEFICFSVLET